MNDLERAFLLPTRVLDWTSARARALQTNLAHASEPGYRRVDVDFAELVKAVRAEREHGRAGAIATARPTIAVDEKAAAAVSIGGNSVEFEREQLQIDKNATLHELATFIVNSKLSQLRSAIRGSAP